MAVRRPLVPALASLTAAAIVAISLSDIAAAPQRYAQMNADELYTAYSSIGPGVLEDAFPNPLRFEAFRRDFRERVLTKWEAADREPQRAMFMLDISLATDDKRYQYWSDFLALGQTYLLRRTEPPGANARMDAFELLWNKTVIAYLDGRRQPELVETLVRRIGKRILPAPAADGTPALIDPWITLATGFMHEGYVIANADRFKSRIATALECYGEAAKYDHTQVEAVVRSASLLLRSDRPADALAMIERLRGKSLEDSVAAYWALVLRGKALDALNRADEAIASYQQALEIVPTAQSPVIGMMTAESRRGRDDIAETLANRARTAPDPVADPWWSYPHGDLRFYHQRLTELRGMAK